MSEKNSYYREWEAWIAGDLDGEPDEQLVTWADQLLTGAPHVTETGLFKTIHYKAGSPEFDRNRHALAILLVRNTAPRDLLFNLAISIAPNTEGNAYPVARFVHTKRNRQDARMRGQLHEEVYELVERGMSVEEACEEVADKYPDGPSARTIHEIYKQLKPYRDSFPSRQPKDK